MIQDLVADLRPVTPLPTPPVRLVRWVLAAVACGGAVVAALGTRGDLTAAAFTVSFQVHSAFLAAAAVGSAAAALSLAVPGERLSAWRSSAPLAALLAWGAWLAVELMSHAAAGGVVWPISAGWGCVAKAFAVGVVPGTVLAVMVGRAAPPHLQGAVTYAALAGAAVGALGVEVTCPLNNPMHLLVWHAAPAVATVLAASLACWGFLAALERLGVRL